MTINYYLNHMLRCGGGIEKEIWMTDVIYVISQWSDKKMDIKIK